jgi:hypothetical protein
VLNRLTQLLLDSKSFFSESWLKNNGAFFEEDNLYAFSYNCLAFHKNGLPQNRQKPLFVEEVTPQLDVPFSSFKTIISRLEANSFANTLLNKEALSSGIQNAPFEHILLIMGQRQTPATIKNAKGLPMSKKSMLNNALKPFNNQISVGVRAWEKHTERSEDNFWGNVKGSPLAKVETVKSIIANMINNYTWWNTFYHYKHDIVFEIRVESGHGMRWSKTDGKLIGFLEPFIN